MAGGLSIMDKSKQNTTKIPNPAATIIKLSSPDDHLAIGVPRFLHLVVGMNFFNGGGSP
jgi:hypothetical protein